MFDENGKLFQYYFDIVFDNHPLPNGDAWFTDLYLDAVMQTDKGMKTLDEDELEAALARGDIDEKAAQGARKALKRLRKLVLGNEDEWTRECMRVREELMEKISG